MWLHFTQSQSKLPTVVGLVETADQPSWAFQPLMKGAISRMRGYPEYSSSQKRSRPVTQNYLLSSTCERLIAHYKMWI